MAKDDFDSSNGDGPQNDDLYSINSHWNDEKGVRHVVTVKSRLTLDEAKAEKERIILEKLDEAMKKIRQQLEDMYKIQR